MKSRRVKWSGHVACMEEMRNDGTGPLGRLRHRWKDIVKIDIK
jgi:hypothetical protein